MTFPFLEWKLGGNQLQEWFIALAVAVLAFLILRLLQMALARWLPAYANGLGIRPRRLLANLALEIRRPVLIILAGYIGSLLLDLSPRAMTWIGVIALLAVWAQMAIWGNYLITFWLERYHAQNVEEDASRVTTVKALGFLSRLILFSVIILLALDNIPGIEITTLLASLGIGGIAVALAVQNILADLFASLSIALDKPFVIGDFIVVGQERGMVEHIGLKTTRVRSLTGEQLIFPNSDLLSSRIHNFKRMEERRIVFGLGVTYQTPYEKLQKIPTMLREIIEAQELARFDRAHFQGFGDFSLDFEIVYFVLLPEYAVYMDVQQEINLRIYRQFEAEGIEFAYPTQTVFVSQQE